MNVVLYGATGKSGSRILAELISRDHTVTAIARDVTKVQAGVLAKQDDLSDADTIASLIAGADVVVSAYAPPNEDTDALIGVTRRQIEAIRKAGNVRLLVVGGAGSLEVAPGVTLLDSGYLPEPYKPIARSHLAALEMLKQSEIDWTYLSPGAFFEPGERTGRFRLGTDELISDADHQSRISMEGYAIAIVDEIEKPAHERARFSIGY